MPFRVEEPAVEEETEGEPVELAVRNALRKARAVAADGPVLAADTVVVLDGRAYGKPRDEREAEEFLRRLSGREHEVVGGLALLLPGGEERTASAVTRVRFRSLDAADLAWYLATGEWGGRAGGYAIQGRGAALVERVEGDYWNVVGLPLAELVRLAPELVTR